MCLGVPGKVIHIEDNALGLLMGKVDFGGITREVCLAFTPDVQVGEYVIVHTGYAISQLNEEEAEETLALLAELDTHSEEGDEPISFSLA